MWCMTPFGFFSIVAARPTRAGSNKDMLIVRARVKSDLVRFRDAYMPLMGRIYSTPDRDYPYRAIVTRKMVSAAMAKVTMDITYDNFKDEVARVLGHGRANLYHRVWDTLRNLESNPERYYDRLFARSASLAQNATLFSKSP